MYFGFTSEQELFRDSLRSVLEERCPPAAVRAAWHREDGGRSEIWAHLAALGVVGLTAPELHGGLGLGEVDLVLLLEEAGRFALPDPLLETTAVGIPMLCELGAPELAARWVGPAAAGEKIVTIGLAHAPYVAHADTADLLLLCHEDALHAVPPSEVRLVRQPSVDGARRLFAVQWAPSARTRVAGGAHARRAMERAFERGALAAAAELVGLARRMLDMTVAYAKVRHQFGRPIGSFQAVKHLLASALLALEMARPAVYRAAWSVAHEDALCALHVSMAKARASDAALEVARAALQCHGAIGYTQEYDLHLFMKRAWALAADWGDAAWHRERVATRILDRAEATDG